MSEHSENASCPHATVPPNPAAQVIDYTPIPPATRRPASADPMSPYETLAYLAYVLPARIYAANPDLYKEHFQ